MSDRQHMREMDLISAALNLAGTTKSAAALLPIPNTSPQLYVAYGEAGYLRELAEQALVDPFVGADTGLPLLAIRAAAPAPGALTDIRCASCDWIGSSADLHSGDDDGFGPRGVCPNCGADEAEFATVQTAAQGALTDALPVDIYGRPVAWRVHLRAKGEAPTVDYDQPALFKVERSAESWMHGKIDFEGWRGAWMEPLYLRPAAAIRAQQGVVSDAARLDKLEELAESAYVGMCFEIDGGVHMTIEAPSSEPAAYRNMNSIRAALDAAIQTQVGAAAEHAAPNQVPPSRNLTDPDETPAQERDALNDEQIDLKGTEP